MLIITKQGIENLIHRLSTPTELAQCQDEVRKMLEIESELLWWADSGKCCRWQASAYFIDSVQILKDILNFLEEGNTSQALSLLKEYANQLKEDEDRRHQGLDRRL